MKPNKVLFLFLAASLFTLAFIVGNLPKSTPVAAPTKLAIATLTPTRAVTSTPFSIDSSATQIPLWVTDFANPIIAATANRVPDFQDDFSLNHRWFNIMSGEPRRLYAEIHDGLLFLRLPEKTKDSFVYNTKIDRRNFVLTVDLWFDHSQPEDTVRFQFDQSKDQSVAFDLSNNKNWKFSWGTRDSWQAISGVYEHFPPQHIPVMIILQGNQCAVYLNNVPLMHVSDCRPSPTSHLWPSTFHVFRNSESAVTAVFDNLKLWDLDKIRNLPKVPASPTPP